MKKLKKPLLMLLMIISLPGTSLGKDCQTKLNEAIEVIDQCDVAIEAKQNEVDKLKIAFDEQHVYATQTQTNLNIATDKLRSPLRNPLFMGGLGIAIGIVIGVFAK